MISQSITFLFREVLYGTAQGTEGTCFVQGNEALIQTLNNLTAEQASTPPAPNISTIAAHLIHTNYYLSLGIQNMNGQNPEGDWPGSWAKQTVTSSDYQAEIEKLESQLDQFLTALDNVDLTEKWTLIDAIANVCHAAYHLGAIRQLNLLITVKA